MYMLLRKNDGRRSPDKAIDTTNGYVPNYWPSEDPTEILDVDKLPDIADAKVIRHALSGEEPDSPWKVHPSHPRELDNARCAMASTDGSVEDESNSPDASSSADLIETHYESLAEKSGLRSNEPADDNVSHEGKRGGWNRDNDPTDDHASQYGSSDTVADDHHGEHNDGGDHQHASSEPDHVAAPDNGHGRESALRHDDQSSADEPSEDPEIDDDDDSEDSEASSDSDDDTHDDSAHTHTSDGSHDGGLHGIPSIVDASSNGSPASNTGRWSPSSPQGVTYDPAVVLTSIPTSGVGVTYGQTFQLHSNPTSPFKVYLDFDGHTTTGTSWNSYWGQSTFYSPAFMLGTDGSEAFTATELTSIQNTWQRMAEYFAPFNIDVTTEDPGLEGLRRTSTTDQSFGVRVVITDEEGKNFGGIAYIGSFDWDSDTPVYAYANRLADSVKYIADAAAHEVGHSLGLSHDGQTANGTTTDYYYGHGTGATDWAPTMGVGYNANIVQWSKGEYFGANQLQDDLAIITTQNSGVGFRADDYGSSSAAASALSGTVAGGTATINTYGIINNSGATNDTDWFMLNVSAGGSINLTASSWTQVYVSGGTTPTYDQSPFTMLDLEASVYDSANRLIATFNDPARLDAPIALSNLAGGLYYIKLDGVGFGTPLSSTPTGYTDYGSLGQYMLTGTYSIQRTGVLTVSTSALQTSETGSSGSLSVRLIGAQSWETATVNITGLDTTEGSLSATQITLNQANNWTAPISVVGRNDKDDDGNIAYSLTFSASGYTSATASVTNADNDAVVGIGARSTAVSWKQVPAVSNGTTTALSFDDGSAMRLTEGTALNNNFQLNWEWSIANAANKILQIDAIASGSEAFRFDYSLDNKATWTTIGSTTSTSALVRDTAFGTAAGTVYVRAVDTNTTTDTRTRDVLSIDLFTLADATAAASPNAILSPPTATSDWLLA